MIEWTGQSSPKEEVTLDLLKVIVMIATIQTYRCKSAAKVSDHPIRERFAYHLSWFHSRWNDIM